MKHTLSLKFLSAFLLIMLSGFILISAFGSRLVDRSIRSETGTDLYNSASSIADMQAASYYEGESSAEQTYKELSVIAKMENAQIWLISTDGTILLNTAKEKDAAEETLEDFDPVALGSSYYTTGRFFHYFSENMLTVMVPVTHGMNLSGYVAIHVSCASLLHQREQILRVFHLLFILLFVIILGTGIVLLIIINRPLRKITLGAKEYASGNLSYEIPVDTDDELGYLANTLNYMSSELEKSGEYHRKFIANVSHDFRSPLTSIKGYIEAMLDGTIPPEMQERYLRIVLNETERLNKLTAEMLTLNNLNNKGFVLNMTKFDINKMIKDTAASFEGTCTAKQISLHLLLTDEKMIVQADFGRIQQVLYNLLDNAIKFSPKDSSIEIETTLKHEKLYVSIRDHGIGIPRESLNKIWQRFYKIDASRGKDKRGTGLGLSIVKEIITAHDQKIDVVSTEGAGTEFIFTLKPIDE